MVKRRSLPPIEALLLREVGAVRGHVKRVSLSAQTGPAEANA